VEDDARPRPRAGRQHGQRARDRRLQILNDDGLRYDDEIAKHKILDAIGDMQVLGRPLIGAYSAYRSGHELNNKLLAGGASGSGVVRDCHVRRCREGAPPV